MAIVLVLVVGERLMQLKQVALVDDARLSIGRANSVVVAHEQQLVDEVVIGLFVFLLMLLLLASHHALIVIILRMIAGVVHGVRACPE